MGASHHKGGPAGLFLGLVVYGSIILAVNQCFGTFNILTIHQFLFEVSLIRRINSSNSTAEMVT
jgi:amino acid permease